jgi:endonuclease/exonuclease/phosphatase family metal-dependent hydrolase
VCGDLSIEPDTETFKVLAGKGLTDLVIGHGFEGARTSHYKKRRRSADYMLVNNAVTITRFTVVLEPEVSDHCPLVLEL